MTGHETKGTRAAVSLRRLFGGRGARLKLGQSPGAFHLLDGDISPLYVFFEVANEGDEVVGLTRLYVAPKGEGLPLAEGEIEGEKPLPLSLAPGERARFHVRAKTLARVLEDAGYGGRPKVTLVAEDSGESEYRKNFGFRVDEYLALEDE